MKHSHLLLLWALIFSLSVGLVKAQVQTSGVAPLGGGGTLTATADEPSREQSTQLSSVRNLLGISIYGGLSVPTGPWAATSGQKAGWAKEGYAIGADGEVRLLDYASWITSVDLSVNNFQIDPVLRDHGISGISTPWTSVWALTGAKASVHVSQDLELFGFGQGGLLFGSSPEITYFMPTARLVYQSATAAAVGYGFGGGMIYRRLLLNVRYLGGEPEYTRTITDGRMSITSKIQQPTSCLLITAGFAF